MISTIGWNWYRFDHYEQYFGFFNFYVKVCYRQWGSVSIPRSNLSRVTADERVNVRSNDSLGHCDSNFAFLIHHCEVYWILAECFGGLWSFKDRPLQLLCWARKDERSSPGGARYDGGGGVKRTPSIHVVELWVFRSAKPNQGILRAASNMKVLNGERRSAWQATNCALTGSICQLIGID